MIGWLNDRQTLGIQPGLDRVRELLELLGTPQDGYESVHVTGSNGKGSVATMLAAVLRLSGYRTGLYTSPHLVEFAERIRIDGEPIASDALTGLLDRVRRQVTTLDRAGTHPTFFEIVTAASLTHFAEEGAAWAVIEAGMGGSGDATNVIHPQLAIITNISLEHTDFLGEDIRTIAREKAGIIEPGFPVVTAAKGEALEVIEAQATARGSPLAVVGEDFRYQSTGHRLVVTGRDWHRSYEMGMTGVHQFENGTVVVAACDALRGLGVEIPEAAVEEALITTSLPGRLEAYDDGEVRVIIDGAHNPAAARSLSRSLDERGREFDLIIGFSADKDWPTILGHLMPLARRVWAVPIRSPRGLDPAEIAEYVPADMRFAALDLFEEAYRRALAEGATDVLVTGSLFLAGEARALLTNHDLDEVGGRQ